MSNAIYVDRTKPQACCAPRLLDAASGCRYLLGVLDEVKGKMDEQVVGGTDFTDLELYHGLAAGQGQTVYNLIAGTKAGLEGIADAQSLANRVIG